MIFKIVGRKSQLNQHLIIIHHFSTRLSTAHANRDRPRGAGRASWPRGFPPRMKGFASSSIQGTPLLPELFGEIGSRLVSAQSSHDRVCLPLSHYFQSWRICCVWLHPVLSALYTQNDLSCLEGTVLCVQINGVSLPSKLAIVSAKL